MGAIAIVAYALSNLVHEGLGHGGACLVVGGRPEELTAVFFDGDLTGLPPSASRVVAAGGSIANLIAAGVAWVAGRSLPADWGRARHFAWLLLAVNLLQAFGYLLFSGIGGIGDWAVVVRGLEPAAVWRIGLAVAGAWLYFIAAPRLLMPWLEPFLPTDPQSRVARVRTLTVLPYLVGGATFVVAGVLNPRGWIFVLISAAAASFGGTSLLAWYPGLWARRSPGQPADRLLGVPRGQVWLIAGAIALLVFVGVLGPGIKLDPGH